LKIFHIPFFLEPSSHKEKDKKKVAQLEDSANLHLSPKRTSLSKTKESTMTTQAAILAAHVLITSNIILAGGFVSNLPSQVGMKGRPRKSGRIQVTRGSVSDEVWNVHTITKLVADYTGCEKPLIYAKECTPCRFSFVVAGVDKDVMGHFHANDLAREAEDDVYDRSE
jgi:hypothetical protein